MTAPTLTRVPVLDVAVTPMTAPQVAQLIMDREWSGVLSNHNLHSVYLYHSDPAFKEFCDGADLTVIDGWPVWALARSRDKRGVVADSRIGSSDWLDLLLAANPALTVVAVGASPESSAATAAHVAEVAPAMRWFAFDGYEFARRDLMPSPAGEQPATVDQALAIADLVIVGLGMPRQEAWIVEHRAAINPTAVIANCGGVIDYYSGEQELAPRWTGKYGVEWAYRLSRNPRRLGHRYLVEPALLAGLLVRKRWRRSDPYPGDTPGHYADSTTRGRDT